ncbi:MAG TPA: hypothetical protein VF693_09920 [Allosphingosinicella sp.]|jgi:hypothetical protein
MLTSCDARLTISNAKASKKLRGDRLLASALILALAASAAPLDVLPPEDIFDRLRRPCPFVG